MEQVNETTEAEKRRKERMARQTAGLAVRIRAFIDGPGKRAMDFGCGSGLLGQELLPDFVSVTFVDSSAEAIGQVKEQTKNQSKAVVLCCDLLQQNNMLSQFDMIFTSNALHHIVDTAAIFNKFFQLLKAGGKLIAVDLDRSEADMHAGVPGFQGHNGFDRGQLQLLLEKIGFHDIAFETFMQGTKEWMGKQVPVSQFFLKAEK